MAKARRNVRSDDRKGPSRFFIIALILGFVVLVWWFLHFLPKRATDEKQGRGGSVEIARTSLAPA